MTSFSASWHLVVQEGLLAAIKKRLAGLDRFWEKKSGKWGVESGKEVGVKGPVYEKSFTFAVRIVKLTRYLESERKEHVLSKQLLRSGTGIGALMREAEHAESKPGFVHKMNIALKEANETAYWIELLHASECLTGEQFAGMHADAIELVKLLASIVKTSQNKHP